MTAEDPEWAGRKPCEGDSWWGAGWARHAHSWPEDVPGGVGARNEVQGDGPRKRRRSGEDSPQRWSEPDHRPGQQPRRADGQGQARASWGVSTNRCPRLPLLRHGGPDRRDSEPCPQSDWGGWLLCSAFELTAIDSNFQPLTERREAPTRQEAAGVGQEPGGVWGSWVRGLAEALGGPAGRGAMGQRPPGLSASGVPPPGAAVVSQQGV